MWPFTDTCRTSTRSSFLPYAASECLDLEARTRFEEIIDHIAKGIAIHLFVRENKLGGGKAAPFVYRGQVTHHSHLGSNPMSVTFKL